MELLSKWHDLWHKIERQAEPAPEDIEEFKRLTSELQGYFAVMAL